MNGIFLYACAAGVCAGIALALVFGFGFFIALACLVLSCLLLFFGREDGVPLVAAIVLAAVALGMARADVFHYFELQENLLQFAGKTAVVAGVIVNDPDRRATSLHVNVVATSVNGQPAKGILLALLDRNAQVAYRDHVEIKGVIAAPQAFETNTGHEFDYPGYLRVQGVSAMMQRATLQKSSPGGVSLQGVLFSLKHSFENSIERLLPEPQGSLLEGILLGERHGVPQDLTQAFIVSGLIHVVVLSGYNISIVAEGVFRALAFLPRTAGFGVGGITIILFALMTGGGATTIRACIMAGISIFARYLHRPAVALRSLALAAAAMALWNPPTLLFDPSFILSVLATFGLITISPHVEEWLAHLRIFRHKRMLGVRSIAASTIAVQIFVLPALLYFTGILSLLALPANVLALPVVPLAMLAGFVAGVLGFIHPILAFFPALLANILLQWMMLVANTAASLPVSSTTIAAFPAWVAAIAYIPLTTFAIFLYRKNVAP